ncbi:MAG TPA: BMP family protein [Fimbriimonadaceae bacterium]|nr:BMP family protein [Fimbriimonadaceae bacterium]
MRMRYLSAFLCLGMLIAGCSGGGSKLESDSGSASTGTAGTFKVALLTPGPVSDSGWSAMAYKGLEAIKTSMGAEVANQEATGTKIRDAMRSYARDGYQLVFGHGYEYNEPGVEVAKDFPKTVFVSSSGGMTATNAGAFRFYLEQGFYLCGYLAGLSTKSGVVAMIGGDDVPSIRSTFKGFRAGAEAAKPGIKVIEVFTGNGQDVAAAKNATLKAIDQGADFVIHQANAAAQGVFNACKERNVWAFGANENQNANESGMVIASAVIQAEKPFVKLATLVKDGTYKGEVTLMGMQDGAIEFVLNESLKDKLSPEAIVKVEAVRAEIQSGKLTVPKDEF